MARILIVSSTHLSRNPRTLKEATTLGAAGHHVEVLTISNHPHSEDLDRDLLRAAPFRRITLDFLRPAISAQGISFGYRLRTWLARAAVRHFGHESPWSLGPAAPLLRLARRQKADLTIVHSELPAWVGVQLAQSGRRVAADLEDWHSEDLLPADRRTRPLRLLRQIEVTLLRQAAYTSTTSAALAGALERHYRCRRPLVLTNSFPLGAVPSRAEAETRTPALIWFSQTVGPGRGLEELISSWIQTHHPSRLTLVGEIHREYKAQLVIGAPPSFREHLAFQDFVPPAQLPGLLARHDIGLALEPDVPASRNLTISNKILQYLNAGLAVLATPTAGHREVLARAPDAGVIVDFRDAASATAALDSLLADREALIRRQRAARRLAEEVYCWEREAPKLLAAVEAALANAPSL